MPQVSTLNVYLQATCQATGRKTNKVGRQEKDHRLDDLPGLIENGMAKIEGGLAVRGSDWEVANREGARGGHAAEELAVRPVGQKISVRLNHSQIGIA